MNPLTLVKRIQNINKKEAALGLSEEASWHVKYKDSPYVYIGGLPFDLSEGDVLAVFAQYGEIVDVNLIRDKATGKSKGFAFLAYEDQRSTTLAVDNLNGAQVLGRTIRVDHVTKYKKFEEEDEETKQQKREERGVCRSFQRGNCTYGDSCRFSHDEQRAANTGWGAKEDRPWAQDKFDDSNGDGRAGHSSHVSRSTQERERRSGNRDPQSFEAKRKEHDSTYADERSRSRPTRDVRDSREDPDRRKDKSSSRRHELESSHREDKYGKQRDNRSYRDRDAPQHHRRRDADE